MDWTNVLSTALGTMGGTLITVIVAWGLYVFERRDIRKNKTKNQIFKISTEIASTLHSINGSTSRIQSRMHIFSSSAEHNRLEELANYIFIDTKSLEVDMSKLHYNSALLASISEFKGHVMVIELIEELKTFILIGTNIKKFDTYKTVSMLTDLNDISVKIQNDLLSVTVDE